MVSIQNNKTNPSNSTPTMFSSEQSSLELLTESRKKLRRLLRALTAMVLLVIALITVHEIFVLRSAPVSFMHNVVHASLLVIASVSSVCLWVFWVAYRSFGVHERDVGDAYGRLDLMVQERSRELASSESLLGSLFDAFQDRMVVVANDGRIKRVNRVASAEVGADPCGKQFSEIFPGCDPGDERRSEFRLIEHTFATKIPQRNRLVRGGGACGRILSVDTFPVLNEAVDVLLVVEVARDVTEEKEDQALASHYEKMAALGLLAAGIAHDLGNPLASLSSELQMLRHEVDTERIRSSLQTLERHITRITDSVHDILGFARKRSDRSGRASIHTAIEDALRLLRHDPRARSVRFEVDVSHEIPYVAMKEDDLVLVLINVMVNAINAMPTGGQVKVSPQSGTEDHIMLTVKDTGTGMDAETLTRATQPLFTTKAGSGGTGLGLAVASTLMQRVNGALSISSVPGQGTTVRLNLPLRRADEPPDRRQERH